MKLPIYQVDAFTNTLFGGNPAAVCPLLQWLPDKLMQQLAAENNLSETAFFVKEGADYRIRWFTPSTEVKLCGHATLASAHIFFSELAENDRDQVSFQSASGLLLVKKLADDTLQLDFPANPPEKAGEIPQGLLEGLGIRGVPPVYLTTFDYMVQLASQEEILALQPDFKLLATVKARGVIVTARGNQSDFVSRCFYPQSGIDEDPVTGSAHTIMVPFWAKELHKTKMNAIQLSERGGRLSVELAGDRVLMSGKAVTYLKGEYAIPGEVQGTPL